MKIAIRLQNHHESDRRDGDEGGGQGVFNDGDGMFAGSQAGGEGLVNYNDLKTIWSFL